MELAIQPSRPFVGKYFRLLKAIVQGHHFFLSVHNAVLERMVIESKV